jgi:hypothetical protein
MLASTTITIASHRSYGRLKGHRAAGATARAVEDFIKGGLARVLDQATAQVLLQGLMRGRGALAQNGVRLIRHILDLDRRHGAIMAPLAP